LLDEQGITPRQMSKTPIFHEPENEQQGK
jgi:hypothetical protein